MVRAIEAGEAEVFDGGGEVLPARSGEAVLGFDHDGDIHNSPLIIHFIPVGEIIYIETSGEYKLYIIYLQPIFSAFIIWMIKIPVPAPPRPRPKLGGGIREKKILLAALAISFFS
jgi:hypothetical protein